MFIAEQRKNTDRKNSPVHWVHVQMYVAFYSSVTGRFIHHAIKINMELLHSQETPSWYFAVALVPVSSPESLQLSYLSLILLI